MEDDGEKAWNRTYIELLSLLFILFYLFIDLASKENLKQMGGGES